MTASEISVPLTTHGQGHSDIPFSFHSQLCMRSHMNERWCLRVLCTPPVVESRQQGRCSKPARLVQGSRECCVVLLLHYCHIWWPINHHWFVLDILINGSLHCFGSLGLSGKRHNRVNNLLFLLPLTLFWFGTLNSLSVFTFLKYIKRRKPTKNVDRVPSECSGDLASAWAGSLWGFISEEPRLCNILGSSTYRVYDAVYKESY